MESAKRTLAYTYLHFCLCCTYFWQTKKINIMFFTIVFSLYEHNYHVTITVWQLLKINIFTLMSSVRLFKGPPLINLGVTNSSRSYILLQNRHWQEWQSEWWALSRSAGNNRAGVSWCPVPTLAHVTHLAGTQSSSIWSYSLQTTLQFRAFRMGLTQSIFQRYKMDPRCI